MVARATLAVAILSIAIALVKLGLWDETRLHVRRAPRWLMGH